MGTDARRVEKKDDVRRVKRKVRKQAEEGMTERFGRKERDS